MSSPPSTTPATALTPGGRHDQWQPRLPIGWVLLDVDGTLVGPAGAVTAPVVEAVQQLSASGIPVGYATGRNVAGVAAVHEQLGVPGPHVVLNGAQVRQGGRPLHTWALNGQQLADIQSWCAVNDDYAEFYTDDGFLVTEMDHRYQPHWAEVIGWPVGTIAEHPPAEGEVIKATIVTRSPEHTARVTAALVEMGLSAGAATSPVTPELTYINVTRAGVDKGAAITTAVQAMGIEPSQVVVIGDGHNDLPMLAVAGTAVAMGDADEVVQAQAHLVTGRVEQDGAATVLTEVLTWG